MDQIRKPQPTQSAASRPESVAAARTEKPAKQSRIFQYTTILLAVIILVACGVFAKRHFDAKATAMTGVDSDRYQALFLNSGQVYFGKLSVADEKTVRLTDIYYLNVEQKVQPEEAATAETPAEPELIKLGEELHGPDDEMFLDRSQVAFWENMKDTSKVVEAIKAYKK